MSTPEERLVEAMGNEIAAFFGPNDSPVDAARAALTALLANRQDLLEVLGAEQVGYAWSRDGEFWYLTEYNPPPIVRPNEATTVPVYRFAPIPTSEPEEQS